MLAHMSYRILIASSLTFLLSCTSIEVDKIDRSRHPLERICIEDNPDVIVPGFRLVLEEALERRGIATRVYAGTRPRDCEYVLTYTALRGWDLAPFLNYAELTVRRGHTRIGRAVYRHSGGFALNKWASPKSKMSPVLDQLLEDWE